MTRTATTAEPLVSLRGATVVESGRAVLDDVTWSLPVGGHAVLLGPNGAGKTTLLRLLGGLRLPTRGDVHVLGRRIGRTDLRALRTEVALVGDALAALTDRRDTARALVAAARLGRTTAAGARPSDDDLSAAQDALGRLGVAALGDRRGDTLSEGEWQRVLLARALVLEPALLLLDEPCNGLDLAQREHFLHDLDELLADPGGPAVVMVTHHLEEVPAGVDHAVLLRDGSLAGAGATEDVLTSATVSSAYGLEVEVTRRGGRWSAAAPRGRAGR